MKLIDRLQPFMRESGVFRSIFNADEMQLKSRHERIEDIRRQLNVDTATWGLAVYEYEYDIEIDESKPYSERRSAIKAKMRGQGTVTEALIKTVALAFTGGEISVNFNGKIEIEFIDIYGIPENLDDFKRAIANIKPAHLDVIYTFLYAIYQDIKDKNVTYQYIVDQNLTYEDLKGGVLSG